jgi:hypothetical protein
VEVRCVAITRDGWGDVWAFDNPKLADLHPIVQYGDPIIPSHTEITSQISIMRIPSLMRILGSPEMEEKIRLCLMATTGLKLSERKARVNDYAHMIWAVITRAAKQVPEDPTTIVSIIRRDRIMSIKESRTMNDENPDVPAEAEGEAPVGKTKREKKVKEPKAPREPKAPKEPKAPREAKFPADHIVRFGADAEGVPYGPEHNPKRAGSAAADRFSLYRDGMTVGAALEAGVGMGDVTWDVSKGFITIEAPSA